MLLEQEILIRGSVSSVEEGVQVSRERFAQGAKGVVVKHLARAGSRSDRFEMLLITADEAWHISRPLIDFGVRQPVGVGDLSSGLLLVDLLHGLSLQQSLEHVTAAVYEVMLKTHQMGEYELQLVAAQDQIARPEQHFPAEKIS